MPSKKKKYNARFPPARIKKIMQSDEEVGKVAQAVPVIISRALELFVENLLKKAETVTHARNAKTLTPSHLKQCIMAEQRFDFLKDVVSAIPDVQGDEESAETPRSAVSNTSFVFPVSTATSSSSASSTSTGAAAGSSESPTIPSYAPLPSHPDQNVNFTGHEGVNHALRGMPPSFPPRSTTQSTMNSSVPVIVRNPGVIQQQPLQQNSMMNPGVNSYIPNVSEPGTSGGPYSTMYHQHQMNNPNGAEAQYDGGVNKQIHPYGVGQTDGSLGSANSGMHSNSLMYDHKSPTMNSYQYHHSNQYHSQ